MSKSWLNWLDTIEEEFTENKSSFLQQKNIKRTMHPRHGGMNLYLKLNAETDYLDKLKDSKIGKPDIQFGGTHSLTAVQSAYYIYKLKEFFNITPADLHSITDIGGGYGNLCYSFYQLDFNGKYTILDFPIINNIQKYFLSNAFWVGDFNYHCQPLKSSNFPPANNNSLLIATFSINEMPLEDRQIIEPFYKQYKYIMIAHKHNSAFGVDNKKYFSELRKELLITHNVTYHQCPLRTNDHYLIAEKK